MTLATVRTDVERWIASQQRGYARFDRQPEPQFRYILGRRVGAGTSVATWGMLNPSSAGADGDDATIRRVISFTRAMGKAIALVVNVSDYIATHPLDLFAAGCPRSMAWHAHVTVAAQLADTFLCAWGANGDRMDRLEEFLGIVRAEHTGPLLCLRRTKSGQPEHPVRLPSALVPTPWVQP